MDRFRSLLRSVLPSGSESTEEDKADEDGVNHCTGCQEPCTDPHHPAYNAALWKQISTEDMSASVDDHIAHLLVFDAELNDALRWPKKVNHVNGALVQRVAHEADSLNAPFRITAATVQQFSSGAGDDSVSSGAYIIALPLRQRFDGVTRDNAKDVVEHVAAMMRSSDAADASSLSSSGITTSALIGVYFLVCCHKLRDNRCGITGPILVKQFLEEAQTRGCADQVHVLPISHIGGHKFAGNVIAYGDGAWYGRVKTCHIHVLLDAYINKDRTAMDKLTVIKRGSVQQSAYALSW